MTEPRRISAELKARAAILAAQTRPATSLRFYNGRERAICPVPGTGTRTSLLRTGTICSKACARPNGINYLQPLSVSSHRFDLPPMPILFVYDYDRVRLQWPVCVIDGLDAYFGFGSTAAVDADARSFSTRRYTGRNSIKSGRWLLLFAHNI